jgi:LPS export ABC transporter protein LptC
VIPEEYNGPVMEATNVTTYYSDSAHIKLKLITPLQLEFDNGDREFPKGLFLEFYESDGTTSSTLRADYCYFTQKDGLYKATGNVIVKGMKNNDQLDTEELFWNQKKEIVFTDKFVRIEKDGEIHMGDGLEAKQDFSEYSITHSRGNITLDENNN